MKITVSKENYLKAIAEAQAQGETVIAATLARWLKVSAPAVTMAIRRLKRDGFIDVARQGQITLTAEGRKIADRILFRHHLIERMLVEIFGMEWYKVHDEAERLEHVVSEDFEQLLITKLGEGPLCPHGNDSETVSPETLRTRGWTTLAEAGDRAQVKVVSVYERDRQLLEYLDGLSVHPGARIEMVGKNYDDTITFRVGGKPVQLGEAVARKVWVEAVA
ncbi:MAG: metal-dependent transcriptional regulator [Acidobacteria bacterium]|nr:metal-dependent transcriptional regulator [Acidobacteriota bacterium]